MIDNKKIEDGPETIMFCDTENADLFHEFGLNNAVVNQDGKQITFDLKFMGTMMGIRNKKGSLIGYTYCEDNEKSASDSAESLGTPI
jgi:hypothetical protein